LERCSAYQVEQDVRVEGVACGIAISFRPKDTTEPVGQSSDPEEKSAPSEANSAASNRKPQATPRSGWRGWPADAPKPAIAPFTAEQAKTHQKEWADNHKVPVDYTNSVDMKSRFIPLGEFTMGSSQEEIEELPKTNG